MMRAVFFEEDDARTALARLRDDGHEAHLVRERLAGEDDDEGHPWAVVGDAPEAALALLVEELDGWLDAGDEAPAAPRPAAPLPQAPKRVKRPDRSG